MKAGLWPRFPLSTPCSVRTAHMSADVKVKRREKVCDGGWSRFMLFMLETGEQLETPEVDFITHQFKEMKGWLRWIYGEQY